MNDGTRLVHIKKIDGTYFSVNIPSTAVITYGHLHPGSKGGFSPSSHDDKYVLRIYEGTGANRQQTAVFRGVDQFVDAAYDITFTTDYAGVFVDGESAFLTTESVPVNAVGTGEVFIAAQEVWDTFTEADVETPETADAAW